MGLSKLIHEGGTEGVIDDRLYQTLGSRIAVFMLCQSERKSNVLMEYVVRGLHRLMSAHMELRRKRRRSPDHWNPSHKSAIRLSATV